MMDNELEAFLWEGHKAFWKKQAKKEAEKK